MKLCVEVDPGSVEKRFQEVVQDFQRSARLPGFREGKAPLDMVEKKFSKEIQEEVVKILVPDAYHRSVSEHRLSPVSLPSITEIRMTRGAALTFTAEFETTPQFSLKNYKGLRIQKVPIEVHEEDVEKGLQSLRESKTEYLPVAGPRPVQKGDVLLADVEIWQNGQYVPGKKGLLLNAEPGGNDDFYEKVLGAQMGEVREVSAEGKPFYKVWIRGIQEKKVPPLDDHLAKGFGKETVEELREALRKDIARHKLSESQDQMKQTLFERLLSLVSFAVPQGLIEKQKERLLEQAKNQYRRMGAPETHFEEERARLDQEMLAKAQDQVKLYFILQKVAEAEGIEADELELEQKLNSLAEESKRPLEEVRRVFEEDLRDGMRERKTIDFLLANAKLEEPKPMVKN